MSTEKDAVEAVFRIEAPRVIAAVTRIVRDVGIAEELAQDALVAALERWPETGVPDNPGAWLTATARHRAVDLVRRRESYARKLAEIGRDLDEAVTAPEFAAAEEPDAIDDDLLRLIFTACHPVLSTEARIALTLRLLGGLTTDEIARAFLAQEATVAQRISRAKRTLAKAGVPFEVPRGPERAARLASVLEVIYLVFNEGYAATAGDDLVRPALCEDALRLVRVLAGLMPEEPEVHALAALLEIQASRTGARTDATGAPVLLADQNRSRWNRLLIRRGFAALTRAGELGGAPGPYALQAAIAACHAQAASYEETDWAAIAALYRALAAIAPSPWINHPRRLLKSRLLPVLS
ncbi:sigma-70 family RNA polymerase sigma factor, partial [Streptomyces sp. NPDC005877]|uniref:RNA polymerase sigma factor n=1 Tax=Streptomyces sp. NPDC005877 TaxID=3155346 RepID=UPI0033F30DB5